MKASEYIKELQELIEEHGDLEMVDAEDGTMAVPEPYEDSTGKCFVAADKA